MLLEAKDNELLLDMVADVIQKAKGASEQKFIFAGQELHVFYLYIVCSYSAHFLHTAKGFLNFFLY